MWHERHRGVNAMEQSTIDTVAVVYQKHGSYRKTAMALGVPYTMVRDVIKGRHGHVSLASENHLRQLLALEPLPLLVTIPACPDCGNVHHGRCNGKPVAIRPAHRRREPQRIADYPTRQLAEAIRKRYVV